MRPQKTSFLLLILFVSVLLPSVTARADFARRLSYQGRLTDSNGVPIANGAYDMTFRIYDASTGGTLQWTEAHTGAAQVTVTNGLFSAVLGDISTLNGVNFESAEYWIEVAVGATTYSPRQRLTASAMALNIPDSSVSSAKIATSAVTNTKIADDSVSTAKIQNLAVTNGKLANSAVTAAKISDGACLSEILDDDGSGSTLDCDTLDGLDWSNLTGTGSDYWVNVSGDTMAGILNMGNNGISNIDWAASDDGSGSGLDADLLDGLHESSFFRLDENESVTGTPAFNGGTTGSSPPFSVDSTFLVTSLNADLLDGYDWTTVPNGTDIWVNEAGDTMTGDLTLSGASTDIIVGGGSISDSAGSVNINDTVIPVTSATFALGDATHLWSAVHLSQGGLTDSSVVSADILDGTVATGDVGFEFIGSLDGITNKGGNVDLATGNALLSISGNDTTNAITFTVNQGSIDHGSLSGLGDDDHSYYVDKSGDTMTGDLNMNGSQVVTNAARFETTGVSTYDKLRVWNSSSYAIGMTSGNTYGGVINEYAMTFTMDTTANRGFIWRDSADAVNDAAMSLSTGGILTVKGDITNYGALTTSGVIRTNSGFNVDGNVVIDDGAGWHRTYGNTGWYNSTYGGGWYMTDATYVKVYNGKQIWAPSYVDSDNTTRYVDPSGNSYFNRIVSVDNTTVVTNLNADRVDGFHANQNRADANTIVVRDASGYIQAGWINTPSGSAGTNAVAKIYGTYASDDYIRYYTPDNFRKAMGTALSCSRVYFDAGGGTVYCPEGSMAIGTEDSNHYLRNPDVFLGQVVGFMICCPAVTPFP